MGNLKIALLQHNPIVAHVEYNTQKLIAMIREEAARGFELMVAPELALIGYSPRDLLSYPELIYREQKALEELRLLSAQLGVGILVGHTEVRHGNGKPFYNACTLFDKGYNLGRIRKRRIPYYDVFSEERFFESAADLPQHPLVFRGYKLGIFICEDAWWEVSKFGQNDRAYPHWTEALSAQLAGSDLLINLSASPFGTHKYARRNHVFAKHAVEHKAPLLFVSSVGAQDEIVFDGPCFALDKEGKLLFEAKSFQEDVLRLELNKNKDLKSSDRLPTPEKENFWDTLEQVLILGIKDFVQKNNFQKVILGLSGGIDSALVAALACKAIGPQNVLGVSMPTRFNSSETKSDACELATNLGMEFREISIEKLVTTTQQEIGVAGSGLVYENLQSRTRAVVLMTLSAQEQRLLLATGNKSEFAMGYSTLYGDMCGALAPIGDLYKTEVFGLCFWMQQKAHEKGNELFPHSLLVRAPSAELAPDQKDSDSLPEYAVLDVVLKDMIDNQFLNKQNLNSFLKEYSSMTARSIESKFHQMEFKRFQAPPVLKINSRSFGQGWQMPLVKAFLKEGNSHDSK